MYYDRLWNIKRSCNLNRGCVNRYIIKLMPDSQNMKQSTVTIFIFLIMKYIVFCYEIGSSSLQSIDII